MPELPEVETVRAGLEPLLRGRRFQRVEQRRKNLRFPLPDRFVERLTGAKVLSVDRRAKYLVLPLDSGEVLAMHLGMTGRFTVRLPRSKHRANSPPPRGEGLGVGGSQNRRELAPSPTLPHKGEGEFVLGDYTYEHGGDATHDHVVFTMSGGAVVTYNDARRFGYMTLIAADALDRACVLRRPRRRAARRRPQWRLPRRQGARPQARSQGLPDGPAHRRGLGNIYVCEALFRARLDPFKGAARLATKTGKPTPHAARLASEIKAVLRDAIRAGGSTLRDYKQADGSSGSFQKEFVVYGREGEPCSRPGCRGIVRRKTQGGRSTF